MKAINRIIMGCLLLAACTPAVQAQKMTTVSGNISRTEQLKSTGGSHPFWWIIRAGYVQNFCDLYEFSYDDKDVNDGISKSGYNFSIGFQKQFNDFGLYYGLDLGVDKTIVAYDYETRVPIQYSDWNTGEIIESFTTRFMDAFAETPVIYLRPQFGFCHTIAHNWQLDVAVAAGYGIMAKNVPRNRSTINGEVDLGFWYKNFLMQAAYTPCATTLGESIFRQRIAINVGYRF